MDTVEETPPQAPTERRGALSRVQLALAGVIGTFVLLVPGSLKFKIDYLSFGLCHQISSHSFIIGGHQCPLCARCSGIYIGAAVTLLMQRFLRPRASKTPSGAMLPILALMFVSMVLDGINSTVASVPGAWTPYETTNILRLITGSLSGMAIMFVLYPIFNQTFWHRDLLSNERSIDSPFELLGYLVPVGVIAAIILSADRDPSIGEWLYWPVALLSFGGLVAMLLMSCILIVTAFSRRIGAIVTRRQAFAPILVALLICIVFMVLFSYGRLELTSLAGVATVPGLPLAPGLP